MAEISKNPEQRAERWRQSSPILVVIDPDGTVRWPPKWGVEQKRNYLGYRRESVRDLYPEDYYDPNGGTLGILAKAVEEAEAEEARGRARATLPEFPDSASGPFAK